MRTTAQIPVDRDRYAQLLAPVRSFGCVLCQKWHTEGEPDGLYREHLHRQAKHHYDERLPTPTEVLRRLREEPT